MPVQYDLPEYTNANSIEDVNKYNKLPYWLALMEAKQFPTWQVFNRLFGKINWKPNMGTTLRGVKPEHTPVGQSDFYPNPITSTPNKNVYETLESTEDAVLKMHDFDSKQFHFLPSFQDFRENQLDFNHKDIVRQIAISNDAFIRSVAIQKARWLAIPGNTASAVDGGDVFNVPFIPSGTDVNSTTVAASGKNTAFWIAQAAKVGVEGLTLAALDKFVGIFRDDLNAPFFEGQVNMPRDNELLKGKYVLIGSHEVYQQFKWDVNFEQFRNVNMSIVNDGFRGSIFDEVTFMPARYPYRIANDGTIPVPEVYDATDNRTVVSPTYKAAANELLLLVAADFLKTIKVGPPPSEFSSKSMSTQKFYSMRWNGEVQLTDQVLVKYSDGTYDTNVRGRFLKFISSATYGAIINNPHACLPILIRRKRPAIV